MKLKIQNPKNETRKKMLRNADDDDNRNWNDDCDDTRAILKII